MKTVLQKPLNKKRFPLGNIIYNILVALILPLYLLVYFIKPLEIARTVRRNGIRGLLQSISLKSAIKTGFAVIFIITVVLPFWLGGYWVAVSVVKEELGYITEPIYISGTGSMYPTFPKGHGKDLKKLAEEIVGTPGMMRYPNGLEIAGKRHFSYELERGDIVVVEDKKIREMSKKMYGNPSGWVKRIIGMPGDSIEIREGIVYLNGKPLPEPYTAKPRSTFGQTFLNECKKVTVPKNSVFIMGDNRKGSGDSREIGFVAISAISHVLPLEKQTGDLDKTWRNTTKDFHETSKIRINKEHYVKLLNEKRKEAGARELKYQEKLEVSAGKRGEVILKFNDFSFDATRSGYTVYKAMQDANYYNIVYGEAPTQGYYEAEELIENQFQFPGSKTFLIDKTYQEIGIAEVEGEINGCPTQVVVQHFAGYVPPNYSKEDVDSWKQSLTNLQEVQPGWAEVKNYGDFYNSHKSDVDRLNEIIALRIANTSAIVARMEANQWLTSAEEQMADQDRGLYDEQQSLATKLNSY